MALRQHFREELDKMNQDLLRMATLVQEGTRNAVDALYDRDISKAYHIISGDEDINRLEMKLEDDCAALIATEQPVARDLRDIITALKVVANLERMGDHAVHIAKAVRKIADAPGIVIPPQFREMGGIVCSMLLDAVTAFLHQDAARAEQVAILDDKVDELHKIAVRDLLSQAKGKPDDIERIMHLLFVSRYLERLGDHVTNICEWVVYVSKGIHVELNE